MKALKWFLGLLLLFVVVPLVIGALVISRYDPNQFKPTIVALVAEKTRGELDIQGNLAWTFWPNPGVEVGNLIYRLPEDGDRPFAAVSHVVLGLQLKPLLFRSVMVDSLRIKGVHLSLEKDAEGKGNWQRVLRDEQDEPAAQAAGSSTSADSTGGGSPMDINIAEVSISDTTIRYREPGRQLYFQDIRLDATGASLNGRPFPLGLHFKVESAEPAAFMEGNLDATLAVDLEANRLSATPATIGITLSGGPVGEQPVAMTLDLRGEYNLDSDTLSLEAWNLALASVLRAKGTLVAAPLLDAPKRQLTGQLDVEPFALPALLTALGSQPPVTRDPKALQLVSLSAQLAGLPAGLALEQLRLKVDDSHFGGSLRLPEMAASRAQLSLTGDHLPLDRYLPPRAEPTPAPRVPVAPPAPEASPAAAPAAAEATAATPEAAEPLLPVAALRTLGTEAQFSLGSLTVGGLTLKDVSFRHTASEGRLQLKDLKAGLYGGSLKASGQLDVSAEQPKLTLTNTLEGVDLKPLLAAGWQEDRIGGRANVRMELATQGNSLSEWKSALAGPVSFKLADGRLSGVNLERQVCEGIALARRKPLTREWPAETRFDDLGGRIEFQQGKGQVKRLGGGLPTVSVAGSGTLDLPAEALDLLLKLTITGDVANQDPACEVNKRYRRIAWPVRCEGPLSAPAGELCRLDQDELGKVAKGLIRQEAKTKVQQKVKEKLSPEARQKLKDVLPGLLK